MGMLTNMSHDSYWDQASALVQVRSFERYFAWLNDANSHNSSVYWTLKASLSLELKLRARW